MVPVQWPCGVQCVICCATPSVTRLRVASELWSVNYPPSSTNNRTTRLTPEHCCCGCCGDCCCDGTLLLWWWGGGGVPCSSSPLSRCCGLVLLVLLSCDPQQHLDLHLFSFVSSSTASSAVTTINCEYTNVVCVIYSWKTVFIGKNFGIDFILWTIHSWWMKYVDMICLHIWSFYFVGKFIQGKNLINV